jgi:Protein of unknown function (DUF2809)
MLKFREVATPHRLRYGVAILITIVLGLGSRIQSLPMPTMVRDNGGDLLSATCIFFGLCFWAERWSLLKSAMVAFIICVLIELQQLYQADWAVRFRANRVVGTFLGHGFLWIDLFRYFVGVLIGVALAASWPLRVRDVQVGAKSGA